MNDSFVIDAADARLLNLLQRNNALPNQALAEAAGVSPATAHRRIRRLVDAGLIERQMAVVAADRLPGLSAVVEITLDRQGAEHLAAFEVRAVAEACVQQCYRVTPGPDVVLVIRVADMEAYQALVSRLFTQDANVRNVKAFFVTRRAKFEPAIAVAAAKV